MTHSIVRNRKARVLVVDDDQDLAAFLVDVLNASGHDASACHAATSAMASIEETTPDLVVTDVHMEGTDGIALIEWVRGFDPRVAIIAITAFGSIETAVRAVRAGAYDYLTKPFEPQAFRLGVDRALETTELRSELRRLRDALGERFGIAGLVGRSRALAEISALVQRVADSSATVLVTGPSGSGKELIARALHTESKRRNARFVAVNCAAIPDTLLESELFGYKKGAFTDAKGDRTGLFQEAHRGTLFLDEIGDLPMALQAKILRVLQEREVRPLGAARGEAIDVRVVAATHHDLRKAVQEGRFREDLFYRLAVIEVGVPALRDRPEDVLPLAEHFLKRFTARASAKIRGFSGAAVKRMESYHWPGNVRELENAVERAVALAREELVTPDDLPPSLASPEPGDFLTFAAEREMTLDELTMAYLRRVLERTGNNKKRTARILGVDRRTVQRWLGERPDADDDT
ncbi:MAG: sigma-54-dependent Fis family transcriptional regulator [Myxococcales bacterium]|nr:sigma-54-dependent Fis family transcriptional regulator [Myxococcales bacterium]